MVFITLCIVRQPKSNIFRVPQLLDQNTNSLEELKEYFDYIKQSALALSNFTKNHTSFTSELGKRGEINL